MPDAECNPLFKRTDDGVQLAHARRLGEVRGEAVQGALALSQALKEGTATAPPLVCTRCFAVPCPSDAVTVKSREALPACPWLTDCGGGMSMLFMVSSRSFLVRPAGSDGGTAGAARAGGAAGAGDVGALLPPPAVDAGSAIVMATLLP